MADIVKTTLSVPKLGKVIKEADFIKWKGQFTSYANVKGFGSALLKKNPALPNLHYSIAASDKTGEDAKKERKAVTENDFAMATLKLACGDSQRALKCANVCCTDEYPDGFACEFWKRLNEKFAPKKGFQGRNIQEKLRKLKWDDKKGPGEFFEDLAGIENLARELDETDAVRTRDLVAKIVRSAPEKYWKVLSDTIDTAGEDKVTVDELEEVCQTYYDRFRGEASEEEEDSDEDEAALFTKDGKGFQGKCYKCGETGHRANTCKKNGNGKTGNGKPGNGKSNGNRIAGKCNLCGAKGHKAVICWEDEKNADKRPSNWKSRLESGMVANQEGSDEFMLCTIIEVPHNSNVEMEDDRSDEESTERSMPELVGREVDSSDDEDSDDDSTEPGMPELISRDVDSDGEDNEEDEDSVMKIEFENMALVMSEKEFENTSQLTLRHPNIWIADTAASVNVKAGTKGLINKRLPGKDAAVVDNGGKSRAPQVIGDMKFVQFDKDGQRKGKGVIRTSLQAMSIVSIS